MNKIQPIYKLNNGNGAMLCNECRTIISTGSKTKQLYCSKCNPDTLHLDQMFEGIFSKQGEHKYKLIRERDQLVKTSIDIKWLEYDENGRFSGDFPDIAVGRSLLMSPFGIYFTWNATLVTEVVEQREGYIRFKTENSTYQLHSL